MFTLSLPLSHLPGLKHGCDGGSGSTCRFCRLSDVKEMLFDAAERQRRTVRPAPPSGPTAPPGGAKEPGQRRSVPERAPAAPAATLTEGWFTIRASVSATPFLGMERVIEIKGIRSFGKAPFDQIKAHWMQGIHQIDNLKMKQINTEMTEIL